MCSRLRAILRVALAAVAVSSCVGGTVSSDDTFLWDALNHCLNGITPVSTCLKVKVLRFLDTELKIDTPRSLEDIDPETLDTKLVKRFQKYLRQSEVRVPLPTYFFEGATLVFGKDKELTDFDVEFPNEDKDVISQNGEAARATRDADQHKMILPLLLMLKMKLKMITPILLMLVSVKATKALVFSKIALLLVIAFLVGQLLKKLKMEIPMLLAMEKMTGGMAQPYGPPPPPPSAYGEPAPATSWEPSASASSNSYSSRVSDPHQMAYSSYYNSLTNPPSKTTS